MTERLPFEAESEVIPAKKSVKFGNERSRFTKAANADYDFQKRAETLINSRNEQKQQGMQLINQFMSAMREKIIPENRGTISIEFEKDLRAKLIKLCIELDNDEAEPNVGMGSATLIALLLKVVMLQRDRINELDHRLFSIEKKSSSNSAG